MPSFQVGLPPMVREGALELEAGRDGAGETSVLLGFARSQDWIVIFPEAWSLLPSELAAPMVSADVASRPSTMTKPMRRMSSPWRIARGTPGREPRPTWPKPSLEGRAVRDAPCAPFLQRSAGATGTFAGGCSAHDRPHPSGYGAAVVVSAWPAHVADLGSRIEARVLGGFEVIVDGRSISRADWERRSAERLFKLLLITPGHRISREVACETLWPAASPEIGRARLRKAIHFVGLALRDRGPLLATRSSIGLRTERLSLDLDRLAAALAAVAPTGSVGSPRGDAIQAIVELGAAELLPDEPYEDWIIGPRERIAGRWQLAAIQAAQQARSTGQFNVAHELVEQLLQRDPTDEAAHRLAIELYAAEGRHHAARRQLEECRRALREGLDAEPAPETVALLETLEPSSANSASPMRALLVGRSLEIESLEPLLDRVVEGHRAALVIRGPVGIGKTRLLEELVSYARSAGWRTLTWQAVRGGKTIAYAPLRISLASWLQPAEVILVVGACPQCSRLAHPHPECRAQGDPGRPSGHGRGPRRRAR